MKALAVSLVFVLALPAASQTGSWSAAPEAEFRSSAPQAWVAFGHVVAVDSGTAVVGSVGEERVTVFERDAVTGGWSESAALVASDGNSGDQFGRSVAIFGDTILVGAREHDHLGTFNSGAAYVFQRDTVTGMWSDRAKLVASDFGANDLFGSGTAVWEDTVVVGAVGWSSGAGAVYVFEAGSGAQGAWSEVARVTVSGGPTGIGSSVALDGDVLVLGSPQDFWNTQDPGVVYVHERGQGGANAWGLVAVLSNATQLPGDAFGTAVDVWGQTIVVGSPGQDTDFEDVGALYVFERDQGGPGAWGQTQEIVPGTQSARQRYGQSASLTEGLAVVGVPGEFGSGPAGRVQLLELDGAKWNEVAEFTELLAWGISGFGESVGLSSGAVVAGAPNADQVPNIGQVTGLALDTTTGTLYGIDETFDQLIVVDPSTGLGTHVGSLGFTNVQSLAFDPLAGTLYATDEDTGQLIAIDPLTGAGTAIGVHGYANVRGLAFDPSTGALYAVGGSGSGNPELAILDTSTGAASPVGSMNHGSTRSLAVDPATNQLYALRDSFGQLLSVDKTTGATTVLGSPGAFASALAGSFTQDLLHASVSIPGELLAVDTVLATKTLVGNFGTTPWLQQAGLAFAYRLDAPSEVYCTAGTSASGCQASLSALGTASVAQVSGFVLAAAGVEGQKNGLFFFGANGRQAGPWGNGTSFQCVVPPVRRAGLGFGGGSQGACDGSFVQDLNALWCASCPKPLNNPGAGALVQAQLWYRDPLNTSNQSTSLSNAVEFPVGP